MSAQTKSKYKAGPLLAWVGLSVMALGLAIQTTYADDTTTLTALLNGPSNVIILATGTYRVDQVTIPANKSLIGGAPRPHIVHSTSNSPMITLSANSTLSNIDLSGFWATNNPIPEDGLHVGSVTGVALRNVAMDHFQYAIQTDHTGESLLPPMPVGSGMTIENCQFHDVARAASIVNSRSVLCRSNMLTDIAEHGFEFWGYWDVTPDARYCSDLTFVDNLVSNVPGGAGIWGTSGDRILMLSNRVYQVGDMCLDLEFCADSQIRDNRAEGAYYGCIGIYFAASNIVVSNNTVINDRYAPADTNGWWVRAGIWLNDANAKQYVTLIANSITNSPDLLRRSIWVQSTNVNHITARYNRLAGASNWWVNTAIPQTNFSIVDGVLTGIDPTNALPPLTSSLVPYGNWKFFKGLAAPSVSSNAWVQPGFDDSTWATGTLPFWYGDPTTGYELTDMFTNYTTLYLRRAFYVADPSGITNLALRVDYDDAMAVWINGTLAWSSTNTPSTLTYTSTATSVHNWSGDTPGFALPAETHGLSSSLLVAGTNTIAVMGLNGSLLSSDLHQELSLDASFGISDDDHDGIPDGWETQWFGGLGRSAPDSDYDDDGFSDDAECLADTNPTDPESLLGVESCSSSPSNTTLLSWSSEPNKIYTVETTDVATSHWTIAAGSLPATPPANVYTTAVNTLPSRFFRIRLD